MNVNKAEFGPNDLLGTAIFVEIYALTTTQPAHAIAEDHPAWLVSINDHQWRVDLLQQGFQIDLV